MIIKIVFFEVLFLHRYKICDVIFLLLHLKKIQIKEKHAAFFCINYFLWRVDRFMYLLKIYIPEL